MNQLLRIFIILLPGLITKARAAQVREVRYQYTSLYCDSENRIWIGTAMGLYEFRNGYSNRIPNTPNLYITALSSFYNQLLIGTRDGTVYTYDLSTKQFTRRAQLKSEISSFCHSPGFLCISTKGHGLCFINPYRISILNEGKGIGNGFVYQCIPYRNKMYSATDAGIYCNEKNGNSVEFTLRGTLPDQLITAMALWDDRLLCGTQQGDVFFIGLKDHSVQRLPVSECKGSQIHSVLPGKRIIYIGSDSGAYRFDVLSGKVYTEIDHRPVLHIAYDQEATVWFQGPHELISSTEEQMILHRNIADIPCKLVHAVWQDKNQGLWFTPDQGLCYYHFLQDEFRKYTLTPPDKLTDITGIYRDARNNLWVSTMGAGLFRFDSTNKQFRSIPVSSGEENTGLLGVNGNSTSVWAYGLNGVWSMNIADPSFQFKPLLGNVSSSMYVYQVKEDSKGRIWMATDGKGLIYLEGNGLHYFSQEKKIPVQVVYSVVEDSIHQIWFSDYQNGIYIDSGNKIIHLDQSNGLSSNEITSLIPYQKEYVVASSNVGIDLIHIHTRAVTHFYFNSYQSACIPEVNAIAGNSGYVMLGCDKGLLEFRLPEYRTAFAAEAFIEDILVMNQVVSHSKTKFDAGDNFFKFKIGSRWNENELLYFRYRMQGLNMAWNQTVDKEVVFPRLNPGRYTFDLEVANNRQFMNASRTSYSFIILNPFYRQWWFLSGMAALLISGIILFMRFRERRLNRMEKLEKEKLMAEFQALKHQVSPHFLFNSFNTLIQIIDEDPEAAIEYAQMLSEFYRSLLSYRDVDLVSLEEELGLLEKYIYLQKMRFGESLIFENSCSANQIEGYAIPPLTLQLLAENAVKHNTISSSKPLQITVRIDDTHLVLRNNLNPKLQQAAGEHVGLENIQNRFRLLTKKGVEIQVNDNNFTVLIPLIES